jgi:hypothetical protein
MVFREGLTGGYHWWVLVGKKIGYVFGVIVLFEAFLKFTLKLNRR